MKKALSLYVGSSFLLHLVWENAQAPLYAGYTSFPQHFRICLKGALGDLLFMLDLYLAVALLHRNLCWITDGSAVSRPLTWIILLLLGGLLAVSFEWWAVFAAHRWAYGSMPLLPGGIGLTPVLQMILIPPMSLLLTARFLPSS